MTDDLNRAEKKNSIQIKIGLLMILAVVLLSATSYLAYRNLSLIVSSINIDIKPETRLLSIRDITTDLEKAENSVRIYTITRDSSDLRPYYTIISNIDDKVGKLRSECGKDTILLAQTNDISRLIEENIFIWNEMLLLNHDEKVVDYMKQLSDQLNSASENKQKKEKGILKRVFSRNSKSMIDEKAIIDNLNKIVRQNQVASSELITRESQLAKTSGEIREKFYDLITKIENDGSELIKSKSAAAQKIAGKTYMWLITFSISGGLLSLLVLFVIIRYVRQVYSYQIALEISKQEAEQLARTKEMFMANISHEIRTPVTAISGFTDQLLHEPLDENTTGSLKIIKSSSDHLLKIIDDILDFSKLENNKLVLEKVNFSISQILEDVNNMFEKAAQQNNTRLTYTLSPETPRVLLGDPYRLKQIFINLISNSVKFTKNGSVHYAVSGTKKKSGEIDLVLEFTDTGIGIDESKLNVIFEDFTQAEMNTTRKYGGTGLGLSIVRQLVELHHGTIDLKSRKNHGTSIVCHLPFMPGDEKQTVKVSTVPETVPEEISKLKILIVDDEEYNRLLFKKIFSSWKIECQEAVNGMDALELLKENKFDLIFLDLLMPGIDGLKTARFIRDEMKIKESDMLLVFISAAPMGDDFRKYNAAGMNAFLQKPFTEKMLLDTLVKVVGIRAGMPVSTDTGDGSAEPESNGRIDLKSLYHISGGDQQFVKQMLESFTNTTSKGLSEMQEAVLSEKWETVANLAHKLLPPCRHIGAMDLFNLLREIESNSRNNINTGSVEELTGKSLREFEIVKGLLEEHVAKMS
jgi:signal transduction histidine kinase/CheY-like chemotaxis protein/HPt (histidine-containing phosphotransfer) domain-containing protein